MEVGILIPAALLNNGRQSNQCVHTRTGGVKRDEGTILSFNLGAL